MPRSWLVPKLSSLLSLSLFWCDTLLYDHIYPRHSYIKKTLHLMHFVNVFRSPNPSQSRLRPLLLMSPLLTVIPLRPRQSWRVSWSLPRRRPRDSSPFPASRSHSLWGWGSTGARPETWGRGECTNIKSKLQQKKPWNYGVKGLIKKTDLFDTVKVSENVFGVIFHFTVFLALHLE